VDQMEVLSSSLSDDSRVGSVEVDVLGNLLPQSLEDGGGSGEVKTGKGLVVDALLDDLGSGSLDVREEKRRRKEVSLRERDETRDEKRSWTNRDELND